MGQTNYQFERRKRDMEKMRKQAAKRQRKLERKKERGAEATPQPPTV